MQPANKTPNSSSLAQVVCEWLPSKLSELAKTFSASCKPPEVTFPSYQTYKAYFEPLLLAEVAAELLSASEKYSRTNNVRIPKVRARREEPGTTVALVKVQKVTRLHSAGFGWAVDLESHDGKGPVGAVDNDVVILWPAKLPNNHSLQSHPSAKVPAIAPRPVSKDAIHAVILRSNARSGCRVVLSRFPDGNEHGVRTDLEEGEENEEEPPPIRVWNLLRLGGLTTMRREFEALQKIRTSTLLPILLRPKLPSANDSSASVNVKDPENGPATRGQFRNEETFTKVISEKTGLNPSQTHAILHASTCRNGFSVIQGPPGTGKTRTLISLLNVIHMTQYQEYYEDLLSSFDRLYGSSPPSAASGRDPNKLNQASGAPSQKSGQGSLLQTMMTAMNKTISTAATEQKTAKITNRARRPRLLICAPSNSAVDEILTRLTRSKFVDGQGREYCPELARIGAGDKVSEAAKPFTAEGQAEAFLDRLCAEGMSRDAQMTAQQSFLASWQNRCNSLLMQMERTPKRQVSSQSVIIDLHEKLERMDRDLRRLKIAASDGADALSREEKLRQIARTYVEDAQLVFATLSGSASNILTQKASSDIAGDGPLFDTVVIDEGAQATETSCLIPLALGASRCLLVGDPQQLPATVLSSGAAGLAYGQSLLERICRGGQNVLLLDKQYRMHPAISSFPRRYFYHGRLVDDESVQGEHRARPYHRDAVRPKLGPYVFLDISEGEEQISRDDRSIFNRTEAELASLIYTKLKKEYQNDSLFSPAAKVPGSVSGFGVVTPYKRQMQELRQSFDRAGIPTGDVEIDTVDSFQGREKEVIVFSCVRTAALNRGIGFVRDVRRMNVGLTRARASLIILGSAQALSEGSADWAELIEDASSRGCLISVSNVQRCLYPAIADKEVSTASKPSENRKDVRNGPKNMKSKEANLSGSVMQRGSHGSGRSDPRRRAAERRIQNSRSEIVGGQQKSEGIGQRGIRVAADGEMGRNLVRQRGSGQVSGDGGETNALEMSGAGLNGMSSNGMQNAGDLDARTAELRGTLNQMTKVLANAGFTNTKGLEEALTEHINTGGSLDLETVIAAAIASCNVPNVQGGEGNAAQSVAAVLGSAEMGHALQMSKTLTLGGGGQGKNGKGLDGKETVGSKNGESKGQGGGSGWDMLFAKKREDGQVEGEEEENAEGEVKEEKEEAEVTEQVMGRMVEEIRQNGGVVVEEKVEGGPGDGKMRNARGDDGDGISGGKLGGGGWDEKGREVERKRGRSNDYEVGRGGQRMDRGRGRGKRGRGHGGFTGAEGNAHERYGGGYDGDGWGSQYEGGYDGGGYDGGYEPAYVGYGMMGSNPHSMVAMQAMQQQMIHQQMLQQQAAYQQQHQAYQQQMMQQQQQQPQQPQQAGLQGLQGLQGPEAYAQQAMMMQMQGAQLGGGQYGMVDFGNINAGVMGNMGGGGGAGAHAHAHPHAQWSSAPSASAGVRGGGGGGGGGGVARGRSRGRAKYGGNNARALSRR